MHGACLPIRLNGLIKKSRLSKAGPTASVAHWRTQRQCGKLRGQLGQLLRKKDGLQLRPQSLPTAKPAWVGRVKRVQASAANTKRAKRALCAGTPAHNLVNAHQSRSPPAESGFSRMGKQALS